jgi:nucleotide-binding universal stress UspA family protein
MGRISAEFSSLGQVVGKIGQLVLLDGKTTRAQRLLGLPARFAEIGEGLHPSLVFQKGKSMNKFLSGKPVVVPTDFSDASLKAIGRALDLVSDRALVKVLHVSPIPAGGEFGSVWASITSDDILRGANEQFAKAVEKHPALKGVEFKALIGDPGLVVTDYAKEIGAELIVIPSHGRTGISRLLLGSVAERVIRYASCPVLVLRGN